MHCVIDFMFVTSSGMNQMMMIYSAYFCSVCFSVHVLHFPYLTFGWPALMGLALSGSLVAFSQANIVVVITIPSAI